MPWDRRLYPKNWEEMALEIKAECDWTCEWCQRPCRLPGESLKAFAEWVVADDYGIFHDLMVADILANPQRFTLTVAHLDHQPENCDRSNLRALCTTCHCRYDLSQMGIKKQLKLERLGQLRMEGL